jgi:hypothetical protein
MLYVFTLSYDWTEVLEDETEGRNRCPTYDVFVYVCVVYVVLCCKHDIAKIHSRLSLGP